METDSEIENNNLVSIITPVYNGEKYLKETIESVIRQAYIDWELIIIDDCSTDRSKEIIQTYIGRDSRIKLFVQSENLGVAAARNFGIERATGDYIAFLDSDDLWDERKLKVQLSKIKQNKYALCYTAYRKIDANANIITKHVSVKEKGIAYSELLKHNEIGFLTAIYDVRQIGKEKFIKVGHEDYVYWLRILKRGGKAYGIDEVLASYRVHSAGISSNKIKSATFTWNIYRNIENLGLIRSVYFFLNYAINSSLKKIKK